MTAKQWLLITAVVVLNTIIFGALLGDASAGRRGAPTPTWTSPPTFTPTPFPTSTAILMPTVPAQPTPPPVSTLGEHIVQEGDTLESIAESYGVGTYVLRLINRIPDQGQVRVGQRLVIPSAE